MRLVTVGFYTMGLVPVVLINMPTEHNSNLLTTSPAQKEHLRRQKRSGFPI